MAGPETDSRGTLSAAAESPDLAAAAGPGTSSAAGGIATAAGGVTRPMTEADLEAVLSIERHAYRYPWSEMIFRDCLRVGYGCFVHEVDQIVGHLVVSCAAGEAHILNICIAPPWQRQGIAHHLLNVAVERAQLLAAQMLFLEVRPSNVPACRLYQQFGFNEVGRRPGYYPAPHGREDALIMAREVAF